MLFLEKPKPRRGRAPATPRGRQPRKGTKVSKAKVQESEEEDEPEESEEESDDGKRFSSKMRLVVKQTILLSKLR